MLLDLFANEVVNEMADSPTYQRLKDVRGSSEDSVYIKRIGSDELKYSYMVVAKH